MVSSILANKSSLQSVVTMPMYPSNVAKTSTKAALKEEGITSDQVTKAAKYAVLVQDTTYWDSLAGIAQLWEPFAEVCIARAALCLLRNQCSTDVHMSPCVLQTSYALEGDRSSLGDAYLAIHAIDQCISSLDENNFALMSGIVEALQASSDLHHSFTAFWIC